MLRATAASKGILATSAVPSTSADVWARLGS